MKTQPQFHLGDLVIQDLLNNGTYSKFVNTGFSRKSNINVYTFSRGEVTIYIPTVKCCDITLFLDQKYTSKVYVRADS